MPSMLESRQFQSHAAVLGIGSANDECGAAATGH